MEAGYIIENADGEVIAKMGDRVVIDSVSKDEVGSGELVYSTLTDEILLEVNMNLTGGAEVIRYDSGETILTLESNRVRQLLSLIPVADFLFNEKWTIESASNGHVCTASENRWINPFSKPSKNINIRDDANLSILKCSGSHVCSPNSASPEIIHTNLNQSRVCSICSCFWPRSS